MYAPVSTLSVRKAGPDLVGYAAPQSGLAPCLVELWADETLVAVARATAFSKAALSKSLRHGWCGFEIKAYASAGAVGRRLELRCGFSGKTLHKIKISGDGASATKADVSIADVFEIVNIAQKADCCNDVIYILPFMRHHINTFGVSRFVQASYQSFLGRPAERQSCEAWVRRGDSDIISHLTADILGSPEYRAITFAAIPGPFNSNFHFHRGAFDLK